MEISNLKKHPEKIQNGTTVIFKTNDYRYFLNFCYSVGL